MTTATAAKKEAQLKNGSWYKSYAALPCEQRSFDLSRKIEVLCLQGNARHSRSNNFRALGSVQFSLEYSLLIHRGCSLTWPASMQIYWNNHHGSRCIVLEHQYGRRDVMGKALYMFDCRRVQLHLPGGPWISVSGDVKANFTASSCPGLRVTCVLLSSLLCPLNLGLCARYEGKPLRKKTPLMSSGASPRLFTAALSKE